MRLKDKVYTALFGVVPVTVGGLVAARPNVSMFLLIGIILVIGAPATITLMACIAKRKNNNNNK